MLNHEQLLALIRDQIDHPSTPREMLQRLKIPREQRATFKRLLNDLVASGDLIETRGNRFGLPDRMNLVVGRITTHPARVRLRRAGSAARGRGGGHLHRRQQPESGDARRSRRRAGRAHHATRAPKAGSSGSSSAARARIVGRFDVDPSGFGFVVPFDRRHDHGRPDSRRRGGATRSPATWWSSRSPAGRPPTRGPLGRVTRSPGRHRRAGRGHRNHHPQVRHSRRAQRGGGERSQPARRGGARTRHSRAAPTSARS